MAITKFNAVNGLSVGDLIQISVIDNTANVYANNLFVSGDSNLGNLATANYFSGTLVTQAQPNITSTGTLTSITVSGNANIGDNLFVSGNLTVAGTLTYENVQTFAVEDPVIELGGGPNATPLTSNDGMDRGTVLHYYTTETVDAFMGWDNSNAEFGFGSNVSVANNVVTFNNYGNLRADNFIGNGANISGNISAGGIKADNYYFANGQPFDFQQAAGSNYEVQFNFGNDFAASPNFTFNGTTANVQGNLEVTNFAVTGNIYSDLIPQYTELQSIGSNTQRWKDIYLSGGTIYLGNTVLSANTTTNALSTSNNLSVTGNLSVSNVSILGNVANVRIFGGVSGYALKTYGDGNLYFGIDSTEAAGSNTEIQFNNNGPLGASSNLTYDYTTNLLSINGNVLAGNANVGNLTATNHLYTPNITNGGTGIKLDGGYPGYIEFYNSTGIKVTINDDGNIIAPNANLGNAVSSNYFIGNGHYITGMRLDTNLVDVNLPSPAAGQYLSYNGSQWTGVNPGSSSAGQGVSFWFSTPIINTQNANSDIQIDTLSSTPNTAAQTYANVTINGTAALCGLVSGPLNRTVFDAGNWDFSIWANVSSTSGTNTINCGVHQVLPNAGTVTTTGSGTSRTVTASSGTPFATVVPGSDVLLSSYIQTPLGMYRVTAKTSDTVVTINTPTTYTNETAVAVSVWIPLFNVGSADLSSTSFTEYLFGTTQPAYNITTDSAIGVLLTATTSTSKSIYVTINGTNQASHFTTPLATKHDSLAGLQGGTANEYYHLTLNEYNGNGTGNFIRQSGATLLSPNIDSATGTSLSLTGNVSANNVISINANLGNLAVANYFAGILTTAIQPNITSLGTLANLTVTGNITSGNANLGNTAIANYFSGNGYYLTDLNVNNIGTVANANYAAYAGNVTLASQPNITSLGTLANLTVSGYVTAGNMSSTTGLLTLDTGSITVIGSNAGIFSVGISNTTVGVGGNVTLGSATGNVIVQNNLNVANTATITNLRVNDFYSNRTPVVVTTDTVVDTFSVNKYRSAKYTMRVNSDDGYQAVEVLLIHDGSNSFVTIYGSLSTIGNDIIVLSSDINSGYVRLLATTGSTNTTVNLLGTYVAD